MEKTEDGRYVPDWTDLSEASETMRVVVIHRKVVEEDVNEDLPTLDQYQ